MLLGFALPKKQPRAGRDGALSLQPQRDVALGGKHQHPRKSSWEFTGKRLPLELLQKLGTVPVLGKTERQQRTGAGKSPNLGAFSLNWAGFQVGALQTLQSEIPWKSCSSGEGIVSVVTQDDGDGT